MQGVGAMTRILLGSHVQVRCYLVPSGSLKHCSLITCSKGDSNGSMANLQTPQRLNNGIKFAY